MSKHGWLIAFVAVAVAALTVLTPTLSAAAPATGTQAGTEMMIDWFVLSGTVTSPGTAPRHLSSSQGAALLQSWYPATIYSTLPKQTPPANLPVYTVKLKDLVQNKPYDFVFWYVSDGKKVWAGLPPQVVAPGAFVPKKVWFLAPKRTILAFENKVGPVPLGTDPTTTTVPAHKSDSGSGNAAGWIIAIGVIVVGGAALFGFRGRSRRARVATRR